jgi:hypothetical protein
MRWFRSHRLKVASLALFALACQFVLSFGHVHLDRSVGNSSHWTIAAASGKAVAAPVGKVTSADLPASPGKKNPSGLGDDFCAICANISLAAALVVPNAPTLLAGISFFEELHCRLQPRRLDRSTIFISTPAVPLLPDAMASSRPHRP